MKIQYIFIILVAALMWGCKDMDDENIGGVDAPGESCVTVMEDGRLLVRGSFSASTFHDMSISTRATIKEIEKEVRSGWCVVFGEDPKKDVKDGKFTDESPLLDIVPLTIDANGEFSASLMSYDDVAYIRFVVNLTDRERIVFQNAVSWAAQEGAIKTDANNDLYLSVPTAESDLSAVDTFKDYRMQSVGLDGIYDIAYNGIYNSDTDTYKENTTPLDPNPNTVDLNAHLAKAFPMSSVGYMLDTIDEASIIGVFETPIYMIRTCSKVEIANNDPEGFTIYEVHMIECAQESRIRSTVLDTTGSDLSDTPVTLGVPKDLGGAIDYEPLKETVLKGGKTSPIYIFPNAGGGFEKDNIDGVVNNEINPQYIIVKGRAAGYDTDGYYKIALKARYPLTYELDEDGHLKVDENGSYIVATRSDITYDVLRNTFFHIDLQTVDKPGYKTLEEAKKLDNPASNISYSITVVSDDSRSEILVSNGTYYVELGASRVYMSGYGAAGNKGSIKFNITPNEKCKYPGIFVMSDFNVHILSCYADDGSSFTKEALNPADDSYDDSDNAHNYWFYKEGGNKSTEIVVNYEATNGGRIRLRIGDMLKFIPVYYDNVTLFDQDTEQVVILDEADFSYEEIEYYQLDADGTEYDVDLTGSDPTWFTADGKITTIASTDPEREIRARIYPVSGDGITKLYFKQAYNTEKDPELPFDPNDKTDNGTPDILFDGNIIDLSEDYKTNLPDGYNKKDKEEEIVGQLIVDMIETGYESIYIEGSANKKGDMAFDKVMENMVDIMSKDPKYDDVRITIDLSELTGVDKDFGKEDKKGENYFTDNPYIETVVLPSNLEKIDEDAFDNCKNLTTVIVGSLNGELDEDKNKATEVIEDAFEGCESLKLIMIYTTEDEFTLKQQSEVPLFNNNDDVKSNKTTEYDKVLNNDNSAPCSTARYQLRKMSNGEYVNATGYLHVFYGNVDDYVVDKVTDRTLSPEYYTVK